MGGMNEQSMPTITILGTGYVGLTTAALFAAAGMKTYVVDPNPGRLESVRNGKSFFYEEGLDPVIAGGVEKGLLIPTPSYEESVPNSDFVISSVGTPDNPDGSSNLSYIFAAATEAAKYLKPEAIYVQKSTVPVGTGSKVKELFAKADVSAAYVSNPEFLRESTALRDSLWFDRIVVGGDNSEALEKVMSVYRIVEKARDDIAALAGIEPPEQQPVGRYITVNLESAELIKVVSNAFLALKISFANSIAVLADKVGADVVEVMDAVGADTRIGRSFLNAGRGYGGGCFPKDVSGLIAAGLEQGVNLEIMRAAQAINETMPGYIVEKLQDALGGSLNGRTIAVLGLAFKAGTSDARRSPGVAFANSLARGGAHVVAFDPQANEEAAPMLKDTKVASTIEEAIEGADAVIVATDWPEFLAYTPQQYAAKLSGKIFVDAMNRFDIPAVTAAGLQYTGVGRSPAVG
jgi:UDPglucose 6-dehydrogenase